MARKVIKMKITNSQIKALISVYDMINNAQEKRIPFTDISNEKTIRRFAQVLNDLLHDKIIENQQLNDYYVLTRKELYQNDR